MLFFFIKLFLFFNFSNFYSISLSFIFYVIKDKQVFGAILRVLLFEKRINIFSTSITSRGGYYWIIRCYNGSNPNNRTNNCTSPSYISALLFLLLILHISYLINLLYHFLSLVFKNILPFF